MDSEDMIFGLAGKSIFTKFTFWHGVFSKLIPCLCLPVLTFLLLVELAKTRAIRNHSVSTSARPDRTTALVTLMTVTFLIAELPTGIVVAIQSVFLDEDEDLGVMFNPPDTIHQHLECRLHLECLVSLPYLLRTITTVSRSGDWDLQKFNEQNCDCEPSRRCQCGSDQSEKSLRSS
ncbi:unnamed protein product [Caenorhabditis sp. 36 PRJEB53466]|nr:unnamed protein product [Caenorhabditis sp. 36 PRJEB53466]